MNFTIDDFWTIHLRDLECPASASVPLEGWSIENQPNPVFVEANIHLRPSFCNISSPIWLVAAPGAVGKSTLAREISARTGAVYLDLAKAETVAGNYLTGGLFKGGFLDLWQNTKTTLLIDALDEARLRVTQSSFEDFLSDAVALANGRALPIVFFGRVGIIEEAWYTLSERGMSCPIFDIEFFNTEQSQRFIMASMNRLAGKVENSAFASTLNTHRTIYQEAANAFVRGLEQAAATDGPRFAGYAPVLEAVATSLSRVTNPASLNAAAQEAKQGEILQTLVIDILQREANKLRGQLPESIPERIKSQLYCPKEQLDRLIATLYGVQTPSLPVALAPADSAAYDSAVKSFMEQHPFLDGVGNRPSGAVFGAAINAHALFSKDAAVVMAAERQASDGPHNPNPFLADFYLDLARRGDGENPLIPPEHVVAVYESVRARAQTGETVRLTIEGDDEGDEADVEIQISNLGGPTPYKRIMFRTSQAGALRFGRKVNGVAIDAPQLDVTIGSGNPVELVAPVVMNVSRIAFDCPEVVVLRGDATVESDDYAVFIEAQGLTEKRVAKAPVVRKGAEFSVSWPGASSYPWTQFSSIFNADDQKDLHDALRIFRRLVLAFRSHSKGRLARFKDKIEHVRMTKGILGVAIREKMVSDGILSLEGQMYFLDPNMLGSIVGANYQDVKMRRYNAKVFCYLSSIAPC